MLKISFRLFRAVLFCFVLCSCESGSNTNTIITIEDITIEDKERNDSYFVPDYYKKHVSEKEEYINSSINKANGDYAAMLFFTDAHWGDNQKNTPFLINHIIHNTPIRDVFFGGDVITTRYDNPEDAIQLLKCFRQAFDTLKCNKYYLYGNHDNNSDHYPEDLSRHIPEEQVYYYLQNGMSSNYYGGYYNFYLDREKCKTRYICLDTGRYYYPQLREPTINTVQFLINTLNTAREGWRIVLFSHMWCDLSFDKPRRPFINEHIGAIIRVLDDYNSRDVSCYRYKDKIINYDFSNASSKIICCIGGHCHVDTVTSSESGIPIIITTTDSLQTVNEESASIGTIEEQSISAFVIDYGHSVLKMYRIGRGNDLSISI